MRDLRHTVKVHRSKYIEAEAWCRERLGPRWEATGNRSGKWCCFWAGHRSEIPGYNFHFSCEQECLMFALRWAS